MKEMIIWGLVSCQMIIWVYFTYKKGKLNDKQFYIFTVCLLLGQIGLGIDSFGTAWAAFAVQVFFFVFTLYGGIKRYIFARRRIRSEKPTIGFGSIDELFGFLKAKGYQNEKSIECMEVFTQETMGSDIIFCDKRYYFEPLG